MTMIKADIFEENDYGEEGAALMDDYTATMILEGVEEATEEEYIRAAQHLHNTGLAYRLQGFFGRTVTELINAGLVTA